MLGGGVALGAAALTARGLPASADALTSGKPASGGPMQPAYGPALVGATFDLLPFQPKINNYSAAVADWNKTTGTTMRCWKVYYQESKFPAKLDSRLTTIIGQGIQALISFKPAPPSNKSQAHKDYESLQHAMQMLSSASLNGKKLHAEVCLWQEIGPKDMTADQYHDLVAFYAKLIRPHYPLVFDAPGYPGYQEWKAYRPDDSLLDGYALDLYCGDYLHNPEALDQFMSLAGKKPAGIWEIGNTATDKFSPTPADIENYMNHIIDRLTARLMSGLPVGSVPWYNGPATSSQNGQNEIVGVHPYKYASTDIRCYQQLYKAINGKFPTSITA
jgi:hypothetical protein